MITLKKSGIATSKYVRISTRKTQTILAQMKGKSYKEVLHHFKDFSGKAASIIWQTLYAAVSNASQNFRSDKKKLIITEAYINLGPILKRQRPRAKGRAFAIQKKMSHITIRVCEKEKCEIDEQKINHGTKNKSNGVSTSH